MITSSIPFPPVSWWSTAIQSETITFDLAEHYQKMSYRNRYYLASAKGKLLLSLPLENGRNQRIPVGQVRIANAEDWQSNHWKTIVSLYRRSPFFEYFEHQLRPLFETPYEFLHDWNRAGIILIDQLLGLGLRLSETSIYVPQNVEQGIDVRNTLTPQNSSHFSIPDYYQVFRDRTGFLPDCSILDLLFCEGMHGRRLLRS